MIGMLPSFKDWKISYKINTVVIITVLSSLLVALSGITAYDHSVRRQLLAEEVHILSAVTGTRSVAALKLLDVPAAASNLEALRINPLINAACIYDGSNTLFAVMDDNEPNCPSRLPVSGVYFFDGFIEVITDIDASGTQAGKIYIRASLEKVNARLQHSIAVSVFIMMGSLLLSVLLTAPLQHRVVQPMIDLRNLAYKVSSNKDFTVRAQSITKDEVGDTGAAFNLMLSTIEEANGELYKLAYYDSLTGLANRRRFLTDLELRLAKARYGKKQIAVMILNINGFQQVNEALGHDVGDLLLQSLARRVEDELPTSGVGYRLGSDEFSVLLKQIESKEAAAAVAEALQSTISKPMDLAGNVISVTVSIGISISGGFDSCASILKRSDQALIKAKSKGRNVYQFANDCVMHGDERTE